MVNDAVARRKLGFARDATERSPSPSPYPSPYQRRSRRLRTAAKTNAAIVAAATSTSQSMGSHSRPGTNIWWNSSVTAYAAAIAMAHIATRDGRVRKCMRSALNSNAPNTRYSLKCPMGDGSTGRPIKLESVSANQRLANSNGPLPVSKSRPLLALATKMSTAQTMTAIQARTFERVL